MRDLLGGKGAGIAEMARMGIPVPPGFTITTAACRAYYQGTGQAFPPGLWRQTLAGIKDIENALDRHLGDTRRPLLVSVRSGARVSMPGMMDTILNLGLSEGTLNTLAREADDARFAFDTYRRLIQMFGKTAMSVDGELFEDALDRVRRSARVAADSDLDAAHLETVVDRFLEIYRRQTGEEFPRDPLEQLRMAIEAVFRSWTSARAIAYRRHEGIPDDLGTAVNVQAMVFGNMGEESGTGVAFTRDPNTGRRELYGDYLPNAQGEDVVAGIRATLPLQSLGEVAPAAWRDLTRYAEKLEQHYRDIQDVEFTIERGRLWVLQTRTAKRTGEAAVNAAVAMAGEGLITRQEAVLRVHPEQLEQLLHPRVDPSGDVAPLAAGVPAAPGAATGLAVFDPDTAQRWGAEGKQLILVRVATSPEDVHGMIAAQGVLTSTGGTLSHAAVVARGMGKPCVVGAAELDVDIHGRTFAAGGRTVRQGDLVTIDGTTGNIYADSVPTIEPAPSSKLQTLLTWADSFSTLQVWGNADYPRDARRALENGAQGIGLCRTEHMFMEEDRLPVVQAMILARNRPEREAELERLLPMQRQDFLGILETMHGKPVVIRLIDPPLHEFLPDHDELLTDVAALRVTGEDPTRLQRSEKVLRRVRELSEANPMLGLRGCRLGILFPEITRMQVRAIMEAACELRLRGVDARPEIMVPLVGTEAELRIAKAELEPVAEAVQREKGVRVPYRFGTMIEVPRAALTAGEIAREAEFFSFGTNDLSQTTFAYSRDDAEGKFMVRYLQLGILTSNPFETLDPAVVRLMRVAVSEGRAARPELEVGVCGEHGGDPKSIRLCYDLGLNYVSCSPFRVPVARLAAAQSALAEQASKGAGVTGGCSALTSLSLGPFPRTKDTSSSERK